MLNKYSEMTRSNLSKMQRLKVTAIVTIEVHQRDITEKLVKQGCSDENAFEWLSQLRFYMERVRFNIFFRIQILQNFIFLRIKDSD